MKNTVVRTVTKFIDFWSIQVGRLWTSLADFFIRQGFFEKARDVYEEGLSTVVTVRDFSLIFDALAQFEESLINAKLELDDAGQEDSEHDDGDDFLLQDSGNDLDLRWRLQQSIDVLIMRITA